MGVKMIYFALSPDGLLCNLGDHGDWEAASETESNLKIDAIWIIDEFEAQNWATFIQEQIKETRKALAVL